MTANAKITPRTPFLNMALGALQTACENSQEHVVALARQAEAEKAEAKSGNN